MLQAEGSAATCCKEVMVYFSGNYKYFCFLNISFCGNIIQKPLNHKKRLSLKCLSSDNALLQVKDFAANC